MTPPPPNPMPTQAPMLQGPVTPSQPMTPATDPGFQKMQAIKAFRSHIKGNNRHKTHFVPVWMHPKLAQQTLAVHGPAGLAIPHMDTDMPTPNQ